MSYMEKRDESLKRLIYLALHELNNAERQLKPEAYTQQCVELARGYLCKSLMLLPKGEHHE